MRTEFPLFGLAALGVVAIVVLELTGHPVPAVLYAFTVGAVTGGAGIAVPRGGPDVAALVAKVEDVLGRLEPAPSGRQAPPKPAQSSSAPAGGTFPTAQ